MEYIFVFRMHIWLVFLYVCVYILPLLEQKFCVLYMSYFKLVTNIFPKIHLHIIIARLLICDMDSLGLERLEI